MILGECDQLANAPDRERGMGKQDLGRRSQRSHRRYIASEIERKILVEGGVDGVRSAHQQECISVRRGSSDRFRRDVGPSSCPVLNKDRLTKALRQRIRQHTGEQVLRPARREADQ